MIDFALLALAAQPDAPSSLTATWVSILPPLLAISMALVLREVMVSLFCGIWLGAWLIAGWTGGFEALLDTFGVYMRGALADSDHAAIILFSLMIGGMVGIIQQNGGMHGIVRWVTRFARNRRQTMLSTSGVGLLIFFDDYANSLIVGSSMRPLADRQRISREKLAYLVDSTAAPVTALALVTTWIGYQVGLLGDALQKLPAELSGYELFLAGIPYSFYPLLCLALVFAVAASGRDFGPMRAAELRAKQAAETTDHDTEDDTQQRGHATDALVPILVLVASVVAGLLATGGFDGEKPLRLVLGDADSYQALLWGSLLGALSAGLLSIGRRTLTLTETTEAWLAGARSLLIAAVILVLAWSLAEITEILGTADFLIKMLGGWLPAAVLPALVFVLAALTAFATGSSWGTMGILIPLVLPLAWSLGGADVGAIFLASTASVLSGAVWGDHCSPISDTTILSSMASGCDHIEHVRTQLPYALLAGASAIGFCLLPVGFGLHWAVALAVGLAIMLGAFLWLGKRVH